MSARRITRREAMKTAGALVGAGVLTGISGALPTLAPRAAAQASTPSGKTLRIGFQVHRTGIGAVYGAWYEKTANAAVQYINETGGIAGRPVELVGETTELTRSAAWRSWRNWRSRQSGLHLGGALL